MAQVISVRFRGGTKNYYFDPRDLQVEAEQYVVVETSQGIEYARCVEKNHEVPDSSVVQPLRPVVRIATENDHKAAAYNRKREKEAFEICEKKILDHRLDMKLVNVECNFEGNKIIFFFTAEGRVDFRELVKDLASVFRARIELRQIGVRDEAKMLGGLGICGRPLCCSQFLEEFIPVSIKMAKTQNLSLNPTKISGTCGRLMCCLKYEQNAYEDAVKRMPKNDSFVNTPDGVGNVSNVDLLREEVQVRLDNAPEAPKRYKNCEVCVLRNGKGSREGIEIPKERPARYADTAAEEESRTSRAALRDSAVIMDTDTAADEGGEVRVEKTEHRRRRGGRRSGDEKAKNAAAPAEKAEKPEKKHDKHDKHEKVEKAEKKPEKKGEKHRGEKPERKNEGGRPHRGEKSAKTEKQPRAEKQPKAEKTAGGEKPVKVEKVPVRSNNDTTAEKKAAADRAARQQSGENKAGEAKSGEHKPHHRRRHHHRPRGKGQGGGQGGNQGGAE